MKNTKKRIDVAQKRYHGEFCNLIFMQFHFLLQFAGNIGNSGLFDVIRGSKSILTMETVYVLNESDTAAHCIRSAAVYFFS